MTSEIYFHMSAFLWRLWPLADQFAFNSTKLCSAAANTIEWLAFSSSHRIKVFADGTVWKIRA